MNFGRQEEEYGEEEGYEGEGDQWDYGGSGGGNYEDDGLGDEDY